MDERALRLALSVMTRCLDALLTEYEVLETELWERYRGDFEPEMAYLDGVCRLCGKEQHRDWYGD